MTPLLKGGRIALLLSVCLPSFHSFSLHWLHIQRNFSKPASNGTKKYGRFRGVAGFVRLPLQRVVQQDF
jgi:hypothetical protein